MKTNQQCNGLHKLKPMELENITFDLLQAIGMKSLVWRTPGADGGRDIEGVFQFNDLSGAIGQQKWYIECKQYSASIDWPTIYNKVAHADSMSADFLLLVTNNNPSPLCETRISEWNKQRRNVQIRVWRGYEIEQLINSHPSIAAKYNLLNPNLHAENSLVKILFELTKIVQTAYVTATFKLDTMTALEAGSALSELISEKSNDLKTYGYLTPAKTRIKLDFDWLTWPADSEAKNTAGMKAILCFIRYVTNAKSIECELVKPSVHIKWNFPSPHFKITDEINNITREIAIWADMEIHEFDTTKMLVTQR